MITKHDILQWNMGCGQHKKVDCALETSRLDILRALIVDHKPTICALQEAPSKVHSILRRKGFRVDFIGGLVLGVLNSKWPKGTVFIKENRILTICFSLPSYRDLLISNVHLISRLNTEQSSRDDNARMVLSKIENLRRRWVTSDRRSSEIIVGDFNLNPHDDIMMQKTGFFGNRSQKFVKTISKKTTLPYRPLYNPSWHVYGRSAEPLGSIYNTNPTDGPWLVFDQVLMSEDLVQSGLQTVSLITKTRSGAVDLLTPQAHKPNNKIGSDHLPIISNIFI